MKSGPRNTHSTSCAAAKAVCGSPCRRNCCVNHCHWAAVVEQGLHAQPIEQFWPVRRIQHVLQRVVLTACANAVGNCQQVQVVIAQYARCVVPQSADKAQATKESGPRLTKSPAKPQSITGLVMLNCRQQCLKRAKAPLQISDDESGHADLARKKGGRAALIR